MDRGRKGKGTVHGLKLCREICGPELLRQMLRLTERML